MNWNLFFRIRSYIRSSLWFVPIIAIPFELVATRLLHWLDNWLGWKVLGFALPGAQGILQATVTATLSFVVFTFGSLLVAIQVASAQMTPRIIATTLLRNDVIRYTVGLFIFTFMFAISAQNRLDQDVHQLVILVTALLCIASIAAFFYLIDYASRLLRPVRILTHVGDNGLAVIESVYPDPTLGADIPERETHGLGQPDRVFHLQETAGIVVAVNVEQLMTEARKLGGVIELVPQVGDFVAKSEPLFRLYGGARAADEATLRSSIALGSERTMEQDPTFAFRIVVDIGLRALSKAINDPTTGVLAIDQVHRMLRAVGRRHLRVDRIADESGQLRVIFRTPNWEDFVYLAFREIRRSGSASLQIVRRQRAMIENLIETLPAHRHPALRQELVLLDRDCAQNFPYPEDLALAHLADSQGMGGRSGLTKREST